MAYAQIFDATKPNAATQNGTAFAQSTRYNLLAMRDMLAATGLVQGFNYAPSGGTAEQPAKAYHKRGTEVIRIDMTWGTVAGAAGNVTKLAYYYAANESHASFPASTNGTYEAMADAAGMYVLTLTYDASGNASASSWGAVP